MHVKQLEAISADIQMHFENGDWSKNEKCYYTPKKRDEEMDKASTGPFDYNPTSGGWKYEEPAVIAEWEYYKQVYDEYKKD